MFAIELILKNIGYTFPNMYTQWWIYGIPAYFQHDLQLKYIGSKISVDTDFLEMWKCIVNVLQVSLFFYKVVCNW